MQTSRSSVFFVFINQSVELHLKKFLNFISKNAVPRILLYLFFTSFAVCWRCSIDFSAKTAIELEASLNIDINHTSSWMQEKKLFLNMSKTESVIYGAHQRLKREDSISLSCNGSSVTESNSFKYLGVVIDQHLNFTNNIEHVVNKVSRKLGVLRPLRISIPMVAAERLYKRTILPIFDYCDVAWYGCGKDNPDALESLQHRAAKLFFKILVSILNWNWMILSV